LKIRKSLRLNLNRTVVQILLTDTRKGIDRVVSLGSEEFAILMPQIPLKLSKEVSERIRHRVATHNFKIGEVDKTKLEYLTITISIGIAECPITQRAIDASINVADKAWYEAKHQGAIV